MSRTILHWDKSKNSIYFWMEDSSGESIHINEWALHDVQTDVGAGSIAHLVSLYEEESSLFDKDLRLKVGFERIAELDAVGLQRLGLPEVAPYRLELRGEGLLSSPNFRFNVRLIAPSGRPLMGSRRDGIFLRAASKQYTLLDPLFRILEKIDNFNLIPPADIDDRYMALVELKEILPDDAQVDDHLRTMSIVRADAFSLDYSGDTNIHPVLLSHKKGKHGDELSDEVVTGEPLSPEKQRDFEKKFASFQTAQERYTVMGKWYVVLGKAAQQALSVVRTYQDKPLSERKALLENPVGILKEHLGEEFSESEIEAVFEETEDYKSSRISGLGIWNPKVCAYVVPSDNEWISPEERILNVPLKGGVITVTPSGVQDVIDAFVRALEDGSETITYNGQTLPVSEESLEALKKMGKPKPSEDQEGSSDTTQPTHTKKQEEDLVPIIIDNIDEVGYTPKARRVVGSFGGTPELLSSTLYAHQVKGLTWMQKHWVEGNSGALLADDMGLGKTIQTLAFLAWVQEQYESGVSKRKPFLIVAPTGLLKNWEDEAQIHLEDEGLGVLVKLFGKGLKHIQSLAHREQVREISQADWVLTTYESMRDKIHVFTSIEWGVVAFDEVQKIKNPTSRMTEMAKSLDADFILSLTGTPVENRLSDLWSILDTTSPGFLGSLKEFHSKYEKPAHEDPEAAEPLSRKVLNDAVPPIMMRRMKEDSLKGLPDKIEHIEEEMMSPFQTAAYESVIGDALNGEEKKGKMLEALQAMRRISLLAHPVGIEGLTDDDISQSARLKATIEILDRLKESGEKALIFVESREVQELLVPYLQQRYELQQPPSKINGAVNGLKRKEIVDQFQQGDKGRFDVLILSPKAGGVGLTITAANHVIHLSRWWNPAVEDQCTDRAYRIGQDKDVHIYLPMAIYPKNAEYSFDKNLHALLERKRHLSRAVLSPVVASDSELGDLFDRTVSATS